ncbi:MAG: alkaline phosphatase family protein, partial [Bacteroidota bacterium]
QNPFEQEIRKGLGVTFPYNFAKHKKDHSLIKYTPFTNTMIREVAMEALKNEDLGDDSIPDFLTISFSATDDVGHRFGPRSKEVQDTYLRLDREIANILNTLDEEVGKGNYIVFLSADHGATDVPSYMVKNKMPGGYHNRSYIKSMLNEKLGELFGKEKWVISVINEQIYLDHNLISSKELELTKLKNEVVNILLREDYVTEAFDSKTVGQRMFTDPMLIKLQNGYNRKRCGDVLYVLAPSNLNDSYGRQGTDHRSVYNYDTHIPIIFYGTGITPGSTVRLVSITDIAPSISMLLNISLPNGSTGTPLMELFD